jgi:hypothetical protein
LTKLYDLNQSAYEQYVEQVKGNRNTSYETARKKLSRNLHLAAKKFSLIHFLKGENQYIYGNLKIVEKLGEIIEIENNSKVKVKNWIKDEYLYDKITREFNISDNKFRHKPKNKSTYSMYS